MRVKIIEIIKIKEKLGKYRILDRITHHAMILNMNGQSFRRR